MTRLGVARQHPIPAGLPAGIFFNTTENRPADRAGRSDETRGIRKRQRLSVNVPETGMGDNVPYSPDAPPVMMAWVASVNFKR